MKMNGRDIAEEIYTRLRQRVGELQKKGVIPHLVVLLVGNDIGSLSYVKQKKLAAEKIGAQVTVTHFPPKVTTEELLQVIHQLNMDDSVHAIIVQKPLPKHIDNKQLDAAVKMEKDIDGFNPKSTFTLALPLAVIKILSVCHSMASTGSLERISWLQDKNIIIIGKGATGGKSIKDYLNKLSVQSVIIDTHTKAEERKQLLASADIIISAVGKTGIIGRNDIQPGVILIGVGISRDQDGHLVGDYDEEAIKDIASFYTPTPRRSRPSQRRLPHGKPVDRCAAAK